MPVAAIIDVPAAELPPLPPAETLSSADILFHDHFRAFHADAGHIAAAPLP
jgi:hypothetical protein